jgi:hypothetical protein
MTVLAITPTGYAHAGALTEVAETLRHGLRRLDYDGPPVVVGAHLLHLGGEIPANAIVYNTEHFASGWINTKYLALLRHHEVWDYNAANAALLSARLGRPVAHVPLGYTPELARIVPEAEQDIDVLFYGSMNERRGAVIERLRRAGLGAMYVVGVYGAKRDALIARAKIVLSMHYYLPGCFEIVRVAYLMTNRKAVVAEINDGEEADDDLLPGLAVAPYNDLVETCCYWVHNDRARRELEEAAFRAIAGRNMTEILAQRI